PHCAAEPDQPRRAAMTTRERADDDGLIDVGRGTEATVGTLTLRVAEARVEDIAHAVARLAGADLERIGARSGDILKILGRSTAVARAALSSPEYEGIIQIDGTIRANCGAGLDEPVSAVPVETAHAVSVR